MSKTKEQNNPDGTASMGLGASIKHVAQTFIGNRHIFSELSAAAAHYDGLIDSIERAGWDLAKLDAIKHAFDANAQSLLSELLESYPDMSETEQRSFLAPFHTALHQFSLMTAKERAAFRSEYSRFADLRAQSVRQFAMQEV